MNTLTVKGILTAGYFSTLVLGGGEVSVVLAEPVNPSGYENSVVESYDAEQAVQQFSDTVLEFTALTSEGKTVSKEVEESFRTKIKGSFVSAYNATVVLERPGDNKGSGTGREIMELAIAEYMYSGAAEKYPVITKDLNTYSTFMTKVLITKATAVAPEIE